MRLNPSRPITKQAFGLCVLLLLLILCVMINMVHGPANISLNQLSGILANQFVAMFDLELLNTDHINIRPWMNNVILDVRMPRIIIGIFAGACLAICGAVMQGMFRNPLASPSVLGVSAGASLGAVIALYSGLAAITVWALPTFAFIGSAITLFVVYRIASHRGQTTIGTLLLAGVALGALNSAASSMILALSLNNWDVGKTIVYWTMGGIEARTWDHVLLILPFAVSGISLLLFYARDLDAMLLGETHAASIGVSVDQVRRKLLVITALLVGATVSVCGAIGFVGLVVPHIMRLMLGPHHRYLLPASALGGAITLVGADLLLRWAFTDRAIPLGVATASLGAPFFLFLLIKKDWASKASI
ncbi:iron ABC transporter permease [Litoribacillus peritrichatus]|uniref:Iron ABC transporter permease n=1 Tax=Litoribacillus peritrichatus TaxID=718191 RepID=A0ABP7N4C7_9GAMM